MSGLNITRREMLAMSACAALTRFAIPSAAPSNVDVAVSAARWIRRSRITTKNGITWPMDPTKPDSIGLDLFDGSPGVVLFYLELFDATRDSAWLDEARLGANELIARLPVLQQSESCGLYDGLAGVGFVLEEAHRATGDAAYRDASKLAISMIHGLARRSTSGAEWSGRSAGPDIVRGSAGIGLFLLWADAVMDDAASRALALAAGRRLLEIGIPAHGGTKWVSPKDQSVSFPNFGYGTAGVSYFLAELLRTTGDRTCMAGALSGAQYLERIASADANAFKVFHHEPGGESTYEFGWCHGPAGPARLFRELGVVTGRSKWMDLAHACARSIIASEADMRNVVDQCSGSAGAGEFLIALQREAPSPKYAEVVSRVAANVVARATVDGDGVKWNRAETPSQRGTSAETGFMHGAAGIGTFLLHADALANGRTPSIHWPDSPWSRPCAAPQAKAARDMSDLSGGAARAC